MYKRKIFVSVAKNTISILVSVIMGLPLLLVLINSVKTQTEAASMSLALPKAYCFDNYITVIQKGKLLVSFGNSILYTVAAIAITVIVASMSAFVLARNRTRLNRFTYFYLILGLMMPTSYIPLMKVMQLLHLMNTRIGIILLYVSMELPLAVFLFYGFVDTIPRELDEAAIIDGCGSLRLFFLIAMPLLKPVLITVSVLTFMDAWNQFAMPLYFLNNSNKWPMTLSIYNFFGQYQQSWNLVCADVVLTALPVIFLYIIGQNYMVSGISMGAVKE